MVWWGWSGGGPTEGRGGEGRGPVEGEAGAGGSWEERKKKKRYGKHLANGLKDAGESRN